MNYASKDIAHADFIRIDRCPYCTCADLKSAGTRADGVGVLRCQDCDLHFVECYPADLGAWYGPEYYRRGAESAAIGYEDYAKLDPWYFSWAVALVRLFKDSGAIFDLGCSDGRFLKLAGAAGYTRLAGIEFNSEYAKLCAQQGLEVKGGDFLADPLPSGGFDVVTAWSVLEHIPQTKETFERIHEMLTGEGSLFFEVPCITGTPHRDEHWMNSSLEHVVYFTERSLARITADIFGAPYAGRVVHFESYGSTLIGVVSKAPNFKALRIRFEEILRNPGSTDLSGLGPAALTNLMIISLRYLNDAAAVARLAACLQTSSNTEISAHFISLLGSEYGKAARDNKDYLDAKSYFLEHIASVESQLATASEDARAKDERFATTLAEKDRELSAQSRNAERKFELAAIEWQTEHSNFVSKLDALSEERSTLVETVDELREENSTLAQASKELAREVLSAQDEARAMAVESAANATLAADNAARAAANAAQAASNYADADAQRRRAAELDAQLSAITRLKLFRLHRTLQSKEPLAFKIIHSSYLIAAQCTPEPLRRIVRPFLDRLKAWRRKELYFEGPHEPLRINREPWPHDRPLVSVIVPSYNYGRFIGEMVDSLLAQTFQDFEIIVVDCSDDPATIEVVRKILHPKIRVLFRTGRRQLGDNRNFGIARARGKYVCTIDPDDKVLPTYLEKALYILETENCQICAPSLRVFMDVASGDAVSGDTAVEKSAESWILNPVPQLPELLAFNQISVVALFDRMFWKRAGGYHDYGEGKQHVHEDWDFWVRMMAVGARVRNMREELMLYRRHGDQMSKGKEIPSLDAQRVKIHAFNRRHLTPRNLRRSAVLQGADFDVSDGDRNLVSGYKKGGRPDRSILFVLPYLVVGGAERRFSELARFLCSSGWKVTVITTDEIDPRQVDTTADFELITPEIFHLPRFLEQKRWRGFVSYLIKSREIETVLLGGSNWFYRELPDLKREHPAVRVFDQQFNTACHFDSNRRVAEHIEHTIAENEVVFRQLTDIHRESPSKVSLLYNGVEIRAPRRDVSRREELGLPSDKVVVAFIGRLSEEKGPDIFVDIAESLAEHEHIRCVLAGPGILYDSIREDLAARELEEMVSMPGMVDADAYLDVIDILVVPSRLDGRPNIVLEAFARGIPVVASAVGGLPGIISHEENGMLCPCGDVEAFSEAIISLAGDKSMRASLGAAARRYAERELDSESRMRRYAKLFAGERIESDTPVTAPSETRSFDTTRLPETSHQ